MEAPFQSPESTSQMTSVRPYCASTDLSVASVSPYGGRNRVGEVPIACRIASWVCEISAAISEALSCVMCGWLQVWLAVHIPAFCWACTSDGWFWAFCPMLKKVACAPAAWSAPMSCWVVLGLGPSS